jgi:hypothetical protein
VQSRRPHLVPGRFCNVLRHNPFRRLQLLLAAGATETSLMDSLQPDAEYRSEPGDEDLIAVNRRRLTVEWVLRRVVLAHDGSMFRGWRRHPRRG